MPCSEQSLNTDTHTCLSKTDELLLHLICKPAHGSDTSPMLPAIEEIWMMAAFSTLRPLLDWQLAARFSRGNKALGEIGEDEEMRILKSPLWRGLDLT